MVTVGFLKMTDDLSSSIQNGHHETFAALLSRMALLAAVVLDTPASHTALADWTLIISLVVNALSTMIYLVFVAVWYGKSVRARHQIVVR